MKYDIMVQVRNAIQEQACRFFHRRVTVDERMLQTLEFTDDPSGETAPSSLALLSSALRSQPSISQAIEECGVSLLHTDLAPLTQISGLYDPRCWYWQFEVWFRHIHRYDRKPTKAYHKVREQRRLSIIDAILGCLEARYMDDRAGRVGQGLVSTNDLVHLLGMRAGVEPDQENGSPPLDEGAIGRLCNKISENLIKTYAIDPSAGNQQFLLYSDGRKYRIRPFGSWGAYQLQESPLPDGSLWIARGNVIQPLKWMTSDVIDQLESLINSEAPEQSFQKFFEQHPGLLLSLGDYKALHSQLVLHEDDEAKLIPDFFLEKLNSDFCDICDLKKANAELVRIQRHRVRFRDAVREAVAQLRYYRDWFEDRSHREAFKNRYGLRAYRPRVVVVIGRQLNLYDDIQRIQLESELPPWVLLKTYDDVVAKARYWLRLVSSL